MPIALIVAILVAAVLLITLCGYLFLQNKKLKQNFKELQKGSEDWVIINDLKTKTDHLFASEQTNLKGVEESYLTNFKKIVNEFNEKLNKNLQDLGIKINQTNQNVTAQNQQFLNTQQKQILDWQDAVETETKNKINNFLESFEENMTQFLTNTQQQSLDSVNLEIKSARNLIDSYKAQQLSIIEENIVSVLERTLGLVLNQKLTLKDQMDLVYEALEKAKQEKFLI